MSGSHCARAAAAIEGALTCIQPSEWLIGQAASSQPLGQLPVRLHASSRQGGCFVRLHHAMTLHLARWHGLCWCKGPSIHAEPSLASPWEHPELLCGMHERGVGRSWMRGTHQRNAAPQAHLRLRAGQQRVLFAGALRMQFSRSKGRWSAAVTCRLLCEPPLASSTDARLMKRYHGCY
jgi:hypothetical protein